jgi:Stress responsive A/B Barrel Domain
MVRAVLRKGLGLLVLAAVAAPSWSQDAKPVLSHDVYFTLNDGSADAKRKLVEACKKYLTGHEGAVSFSVGTLASELARPVNDKEFDVALHVGFNDKAAHDAYQEHPRHKRFIEEMSGNWKKVRVFDSWVETSR